MSLQAGYVLTALRFSYGTQRGLRDITLELAPGRFYGLIGPNGSGKSTLLDLLAGHQAPEAGAIMLDNIELQHYRPSDRARLVTIVPQHFSLNFDYRVYDIVMMGRHPHIPRFSRPQRNDHERVEAALAALDVGCFRDRSARQLSGGEKQRVMIARALAQDTEFLLLDEVTANLDVNHAIAIMDTVSRLVKQGRTVIAALHDLNLALAFCDTVIVLKDGTLHRFGEAAETISPALIRDLYAVAAHTCRCGNDRPHIGFTYQ